MTPTIRQVPRAQQAPEARQAPLAEQAAPSPALFFDTIRAFQQSAALKAAIDLDVFTAIAEGAQTSDAIASRCRASTRGIRIVCDYMTVLGFLTKQDGRYALTHDTFVFLNRHSPAYVGGAADFLYSPENLDVIRDFTEIVRRGTRDDASLVPDNPMWVTFARSMAPLMAMPSQLLADLLEVRQAGPMRVLDIAAGHGLFGIAVGRQNPSAEVVAVDWAPVLEVARENAAHAGLTDRYRTIAGDATKVDVGKDYDLVLLTNFLHHFDQATCVTFLEKMRAALREGGRVATLEFVPDESRVSPPVSAAFAVTMLTVTPAGDAYTFRQFQSMFGEAGFRDIELYPLPPSFEHVITAVR
jgi:ubiquinone/menaquinone biosynthesis C-methylase UbiE